MKPNELKRDQRKQTDQQKLKALQKKYAAALQSIRELEASASSSRKLSGTVRVEKIIPRANKGTSEATCVWVASDWHVEEKVAGPEVNNLNRYNMRIAKQRAETFFRASLRITKMLGRDIEIKTVVLALLGDFITNYIHDELVEVNETQPIKAIIYAQNLIASGIQYVLDNSDYDLLIPCHSGNHGRVSRKTHFSTEPGHSLEYFMYKNLEHHFAGNARVKFLVAEGYHSYVKIYDTTLRFHHGHAMRYLGGVGGITIPVNKAIAQWNKAIPADIDVFGHWHQFFDGGNFVCNGSLIGYNAFALSIKASFEKPRQALFLIDKRRGKTATFPICFD